MDALILIGRIMFGALFVASAAGHLTQTSDMAAYAEMKGVPAPRAMVLISGLVLLLGGVMVVAGLWADLGALLLLAFLLPTAVVMHAPWRVTDDADRQAEQTQFMKNLALAGAALALFAFFAGTDVGLTVTDPLFSGLFD